MTDETTHIAAAAWNVGHSAQVLAGQIAGYHATWFSVLKPTLTKDGDMWCALYGENLQEGVSGFGETPARALLAFEIAMCSASGQWANIEVPGWDKNDTAIMENRK